MKMNSLVDPAMIDALYEASQAGVRDRPRSCGASAACARACPGLSEQHPGAVDRRPLPRALPHLLLRQRRRTGQPAYYIGSADLMPRNLDRRVEALVPVDDPELQARLQEILDVNLADDVLAWKLARRRHVAAGPGRRRAATPTCASRSIALEPDPAAGRQHVSDSIEREVKLGAWPGFELPDLDGRRRRHHRAAGRPQGARRHLLRHRRPPPHPRRHHRAAPSTGGDDGEWTVKFPDDGDRRRGRRSPARELDLPAADRHPAGRVDGLVRGYARSAALAPVAHLQTLRRSLELRDGDGRRVGRGRRRRGVGARRRPGGRPLPRGRGRDRRRRARRAARRRRRPAARGRRRRARPDAEARAGPRAPRARAPRPRARRRWATIRPRPT